MKFLTILAAGLWLTLPHVSRATSMAFTLQDRVKRSEVVAEVEVVKVRQYEDRNLRLPEAELQCRIIHSYKGGDHKEVIVYVHILMPEVEYEGNRFLMFAFRLNGRLRAFDGQRGLVPWDSKFHDYTRTEDPVTKKFYRILRFDELLAETQRLCKSSEQNASPNRSPAAGSR